MAIPRDITEKSLSKVNGRREPFGILTLRKGSFRNLNFLKYKEVISKTNLRRRNLNLGRELQLIHFKSILTVKNFYKILFLLVWVKKFFF
jgi:hypothetical protein